MRRMITSTVVSIALLSGFFIQSAAVEASNSVVINEFSSNTSPDWVELYNPGSSTVDLTGWRLRDSSATQNKLLSGSLAPHAFKVVDFENFLNAGTDTIYLRDSTNTVIDSVSYSDAVSAPIKTSPTNKSTARQSNAGPVWGISYPTKNVTNSAHITLQSLENGQFKRPNDNPARIRVNDPHKLLVYAIFMLDGISPLTTERAQCDLRYENQYILCDAKQSSGFSPLSEGAHVISVTAYDQYGNALQQLDLGSIISDGTRPVINSLNYSIEDNDLLVNIDASDNVALHTINIYVSAQSAESKCNANNTRLVTEAKDTDANGVVQLSADIGALVPGRYCIFAGAQDKALNNSNPNSHKAVFVLE